ncbi:MAG: glycosyltransferase [Desulfobacterales bacterium]
MKRRTKVVHLTEDMGVGGQEKIIATLAESLDRRRFEAEVWCLARGGALAEAVRRSGIRVRVLKLASYHDPLNVLRLAWQLRRAGADIVHTHGDFAGTFGRLSAILAGKRKIVAHVHTTDPGLCRRHIRVQRLLAPFTRSVVCVSQAVQQFVTRRIGLPAEKCRVVYNGVPAQAESRLCPPGRDKTREGLLAVSVGSLVDNKGHRVLIDAFRHALAFRPDLRLLIVGDGPLRAELERRAADSDLTSSIGFAGCLADVHPVLRRADMLIQPTLHREALSLSLIEAAQHGLPAVASRLGGIPEVVAHGRTGLLVPPGDSEALAGAMLALATDPGLRARLGETARSEYEERFRAERMVAEIDSLYTSLFMDGRFAT